MFLSALACAVCGVGQDNSSGVYLTMTIIVSLVPLAMIGGIAAWVIRADRRKSEPEVQSKTPAVKVS